MNTNTSIDPSTVDRIYQQQADRQAKRASRRAGRHNDIDMLDSAAVVAAGLGREKMRLTATLRAIRSQAMGMLVDLETGESLGFPLDSVVMANAQLQTTRYQEQRDQLHTLLSLMGRDEEFDAFLANPWAARDRVIAAALPAEEN